MAKAYFDLLDKMKAQEKRKEEDAEKEAEKEAEEEEEEESDLPEVDMEEFRRLNEERQRLREQLEEERRLADAARAERDELEGKIKELKETEEEKERARDLQIASLSTQYQLQSDVKKRELYGQQELSSLSSLRLLNLPVRERLAGMAEELRNEKDQESDRAKELTKRLEEQRGILSDAQQARIASQFFLLN